MKLWKGLKLRIDIAKNKSNLAVTGVLSRCKVCGKYFTWECPSGLVYFDVKRNKNKALREPEHCGSSVCSDFWN